MSFRDIKLQDRAIGFLKRSLENKRLFPSLLFFGPGGVGKSLTAMTLAKTLNCEKEGLLDSCDECISCKKIENYNHPDVNWINPEGTGNIIKIERIREMQGAINLKPFEGRVKIFIIKRAHLLTEEAANSILKTLEEPPRDSVIILITDDLNKIFPTLRSRCQWVLFSQSRPQSLKEILIEEYNLTKEDAHFISHLSSGRIGKALSMKNDRTLSWKNEVLDRFTKDSIIFKEDPFFFDKKRENILNIIDVMVSWYRDIFILKNGGEASLLTNIDRIEDLMRKKDSLSIDKIKDILNEILKMRTYIEDNVNPKLALSNLACIIE